jgi:hypothetical protein
MKISILKNVLFLFLLPCQVQSQCQYSIYFKEWDFFIYESQLNKTDSVYEKQKGGEKVKIKLWDCLGNAEYEVYDLRNDSLISLGRYIATNKLHVGRRWVTLNEPPFSITKIKFQYYKPAKVKSKK